MKHELTTTMRCTAAIGIAYYICGCSWVVQLSASSDAAKLAKATKTFDVPQAAKSLQGCVSFQATKARPTDICPVASLRTLGSPLNSGFDPGLLVEDRDEVEMFVVANPTMTAAGTAAAVLNHPVQRAIDTLFNSANHLMEGPINNVEIPIDQLDDYLSKMERATSLGAWDALAAYSIRSARVPLNLKRETAYIQAYMSAYFRHGKFFQAKIDALTYTKNLVGKLSDSSLKLRDSDAKALADELFKDSGLKDGTVTLGSISTDGFTTRGGQSFIFPELQVTVSAPGAKLTRPQFDYTLVGTDILRVLLSAIFDAALATPSTSSATGATIMADITDVGLVTFDPTEFSEPRNGHQKVTADNFSAIDSRASLVDAISAAGIGRVVRGAGLAALNNEALANVVETLVGVTLRKGTEKILWCWYACVAPLQSLAKADYIPLMPLPGSSVTVSVTGREKLTNLSGTATRR